MRKSNRESQSEDRRVSKLVEKQELARKKSHRDRHYHVIEDDDEDEDYSYIMKGKRYDDL